MSRTRFDGVSAEDLECRRICTREKRVRYRGYRVLVKSTKTILCTLDEIIEEATTKTHFDFQGDSHENTE